MPVAFPFSPAAPLPAATRQSQWNILLPNTGYTRGTIAPAGIPGVNPLSQSIGTQSVPQNVRARLSGFGDPINLAQTLDLSKLEAAVRMSERGDTWQLYTIYRDMLLSWSHLQSVWNVRKMAVVGQPFEVLPASKDAVDVQAADHIRQMIDNCENWESGLIAILNGQLYPASVTEKIFKPAHGDELLPIRWRFRKFFPVNELLHCYKIPYLPQSVLAQPGYQSVYEGRRNGSIPLNRPVYPPAVPSINSVFQNPALVYDPDQWEPDLRLHEVFENGMVNRNYGSVYKPDAVRHLVYHGSPSSRSVRDNYGGELRAITVHWFFATVGRAAFSRFMERFGQPIPIIRADMQQPDTLQFLTQAWQDAYKVGALFLDSATAGPEAIDKLDVKTESSAQAYQTWLEYNKGEVTRLILGQELSSTSKPLGIGGGAAQLQGEVRQDIRAFDSTTLNHALKHQLFEYYLKINRIPGRVPDMAWGGVSPQDAKLLADTLAQMSKASLEPADDAMKNIGKRLGFQVQKSSLSQISKPVFKTDDEDKEDEADSDSEAEPDAKEFSASLSLADTAALKSQEPWIAYDLDGTLAHAGKGNSIGDPIVPVLERLRADLTAGKRVKIFTARAKNPKAVPGIKRWLKKQGLPDLEVTNEKDGGMEKLYDDRAVPVRAPEAAPAPLTVNFHTGHTRRKVIVNREDGVVKSYTLEEQPEPPKE